MRKPVRLALYIGVPVLAWLSGCVGGAVLGVAGSPGTATASGPRPTVTATVTATAKPTPAMTVTAAPVQVPGPTVTVTATVAAVPPAAAAAISSDGTYLVGSDIQPGTYKADAGGDTCYWARLNDLDGGLGSIASNHLGGGPQVVTIRSGDAAFETTRCGPWTKQ